MSTAGLRRPLLLTGPPAAGKSTVAGILANHFAPCAAIEVDDLRRIVVGGAADPWEPGEGARQTELAARHACLLMSSFTAAGFNVVATDVLLAGSGSVYASSPVSPLIVHLAVSLREAQRRATTRTVHLTEDQLLRLHHIERGAAHAHVRIDATDLGLDALAAAVADVWTAERRPGTRSTLGGGVPPAGSRPS